MDPRLEEICRSSGVFLRREAVDRGYDDAHGKVERGALLRDGEIATDVVVREK